LAAFEPGGKYQAHERTWHQSEYGGGEADALAGIHHRASVTQGLQGGLDDTVGGDLEKVLATAVDVAFSGSACVVAEIPPPAIQSGW
jgi:hypothetical protein